MKTLPYWLVFIVGAYLFTLYGAFQSGYQAHAMDEALRVGIRVVEPTPLLAGAQEPKG